MKKIFAISLVVVLCLGISSTAFAYAHDFGGTLTKNEIRTTREQKKAKTGPAREAVETKSNWNAKLGNHMWFSARDNYVTNLKVTTNETDFGIVYLSGHGVDGRKYGLAVKNHKDNNFAVTVSGTWRP